MPHRPTEQQIERAKQYLRRRIEAELSMHHSLEALLRDAAKRIVSLSLSYMTIPSRRFSFDADPRLRRQIDEIILWLIMNIEDNVQALSVMADESRKDTIIGWLGEPLRGGRTLHEALQEYVGRYASEIELILAVGLFLGASADRITESIDQWRKHPFDNPLIAEAEKKGSDARKRLGTQTTQGRGRTSSSTTALENLTEFVIGDTWMHSKFDAEVEQGAIGFYVLRGSSYQCDLCDSYTNKFYYIRQYDMWPPYHAHCKCYIVYINKTV